MSLVSYLTHIERAIETETDAFRRERLSRYKGFVQMALLEEGRLELTEMAV